MKNLILTISLFIPTSGAFADALMMTCTDQKANPEYILEIQDNPDYAIKFNEAGSVREFSVASQSLDVFETEYTLDAMAGKNEKNEKIVITFKMTKSKFTAHVVTNSDAGDSLSYNLVCKFK